MSVRVSSLTLPPINQPRLNGLSLKSLSKDSRLLSKSLVPAPRFAPKSIILIQRYVNAWSSFGEIKFHHYHSHLMLTGHLHLIMPWDHTVCS